MENDELSAYLDSLKRDENYRVERTLKQSPHETTEVVWFQGANQAELGPFIRKRIDDDRGLGKAYQEIYRAQHEGRRFRHLPRIEDCHDNGTELVVIMEYVQGETLHDVIYRLDPSVNLAADVFPRLCEAVLELHEGFDPPIIHRDLKPSNILLTATSLTLIDFGIARQYNEASETDTSPFGTRAYAPPEQFGFGQTDVRSDVYSLGMLLYYLLVENVPSPRLAGGSFAEPGIPDALRPVLTRATAFDPAARYQSVRELKDDFLSRLPLVSQGNPSPRGQGYPSRPDHIGGSAHGGNPSISRVSSMNADGPRAEADLAGISASEIVGLVWDGFVVLGWLILAPTCVMLSFRPPPYFQQFPLWYSFLAFIGFALVFFTGIAYLLLDKRWLRRRFSFMRGQTFRTSLNVCLILMGISLTIIVFLALLQVVVFPDVLPPSAFS